MFSDSSVVAGITQGVIEGDVVGDGIILSHHFLATSHPR